MASNYTTNYGLCQWEAGDQFVRSEFNQDNARIDAALKSVADTAAEQAQTLVQGVQTTAQAAQDTADQALGALGSLTYDVCSLALMHHREGGETRWGRGLMLDSFRDQSQIATLTGAVWDASAPSLLLDGAGQAQVELGYGNALSRELDVGESESLEWTATGNGTLTKVESHLMGSATLSIYHGDELLAEESVDHVNGSASFSFSVPVTAGQTYRFQMTALIERLYTYVSHRDYNLGLRLSFTPKKTTSGSLITTEVSPGSGKKLLAWVRHQGGTVSLAIRQGSGSWITVPKSGTRSTYNVEGQSCTESSFALDRDLSGSLSLRLSLSVSSGSTLRLFDYGATLL